MKAAIALITPLALAGCLYGQCLDGPCAFERERIIKSIKPYALYWVKDGMTNEGRLDDTVACGSARTEYVTFSAEKINKEKHPEDPNDIAAYLRLRDAWAKCMQIKGYRYQK